MFPQVLVCYHSCDIFLWIRLKIVSFKNKFSAPWLCSFWNRSVIFYLLMKNLLQKWGRDDSSRLQNTIFQPRRGSLLCCCFGCCLAAVSIIFHLIAVFLPVYLKLLQMWMKLSHPPPIKGLVHLTPSGLQITLTTNHNSTTKNLIQDYH